MQPLFDRVLVQPIKDEGMTTKGGVILLDNKTINEGTIMATGAGKKDEPMSLLVGDTVIYNKNAGIVVDEGIILYQHEVIAITNVQQD